MIVRWSNILCVVLAIFAVTTAVIFRHDISTFLACIRTINDSSAATSDRMCGFFGLVIIGLTVGGVIKFLADQTAHA